MTVVTPKIKVTQDVPDNFYTYTRVDFAYIITVSLSSNTSTAVITCLNKAGNQEEIYRHEFNDEGVIEDIGSIVEEYVMQGIHEFTITVTSGYLEKSRTFRAMYITPELVCKTEISDFVFSSDLVKLIFSVIGTRANYTLKFALRHGANSILSENYVPDANNEIVIYDLASLIEPYLQDTLISDFEMEIRVQTSNGDSVRNQIKKSFTVLFCKVSVDMSAQDFISKFFLSTLMGDKLTALGQKEYLHFVANTEDIVSGDADHIEYKICADYVDNDMKHISYAYEQQMQLNTASTQIVTIDASPHNFIKRGMTLISYKVVVGNRIQTYCVGKRYDSEPDIAFKNSFGLLETLYFTGTKEDAPEISRSAGYVNGEYRNYHIEENRVVKANTGVIPETMVCLVDELARSTEAYLIEKGEIGRQITITDSELKRTNDLDSLYSFQITYRPPTRNQNVLKVMLPAKTFDSTFDKTFE